MTPTEEAALNAKIERIVAKFAIVVIEARAVTHPSQPPLGCYTPASFADLYTVGGYNLQNLNALLGPASPAVSAAAASSVNAGTQVHEHRGDAVR
jgi:hypothetical protein